MAMPCRRAHLKAIFGACCMVAAIAAHAEPMTVDWTWKAAHRCSKNSPQLMVGGIPAGARLLRVKMVDNDVPTYPHGGGEVPHDGSAAATLAEGALKGYAGPCPPNFSNFGHDYTFTVTAVGADGKDLAQATATKNFSSKAVRE